MKMKGFILTLKQNRIQNSIHLKFKTVYTPAKLLIPKKTVNPTSMLYGMFIIDIETQKLVIFKNSKLNKGLTASKLLLNENKQERTLKKQ